MTTRPPRDSELELRSRWATIAARIFGGLALLVATFQLALAGGAQWGHLTMGGAFPGRLPAHMRVAAIVQALVLLLFAAIVAVRARLVLTGWHAASRKLIWAVVAYMIVGAVLNAITPSPWERTMWLPTTLVLGVCALSVARAP